MNTKVKSLIIMLIGVLIAFLSLQLCSSKSLYAVDKLFSDPLYYMLTTSDTRIKIIAIDEKTLKAIGPMSTWTREVSAELVDILNTSDDTRPAIIAFDIMYMGNIDKDSDERFAEAVKKSGNVIIASNVVWKSANKIDMIELPYEELRKNCKYGFANTTQDTDGYIRYGQYFIEHNGNIEKSFAATVYEAYCEKKNIKVRMPEMFDKNMFYFAFADKNESYEVVSLIDVLTGKVDARAFEDCIVMVGAYAPGMMDAYNVAVQKGAQMYGVEIQANILEALMEEKTAVPVDTTIYSIVIAAVAVVFYLINIKVKSSTSVIIMLVVNVLDIVTGKVLYENGYVMDIIYLPIILITIHFSQLVVRSAMFNRKHTLALKEQMYSFADAFATAVDERTPYNGTHTKKVTEYVDAYAKYNNILYKKRVTNEYFDKNRRGQLRLAATLHDIGKMIIPKAVMNKATRLDKNIEKLDDRYKLLKAYYEIEILSNRISEEEGREIQQYLDESNEFIHSIDGAGFLPQEKLDKVIEISEKQYISPEGEIIPFLTDYEKNCLLIQKGTLTAEEREIMESHVVMTGKILSKVKFHSFHKDVPNIAASHHEYLNGTGYPDKKKADELSIESRILTIADIYDALTSVDRPYKKPMPREKAFSILEAMVEECKLDGQLVKRFEEAIEYYYKENKDEETK